MLERMAKWFTFADLLVLPILNIYCKYYSGKVSLFLFAAFYAAMVAAGLIIELSSSCLVLWGWCPRSATPGC
jgi:hypothetical protein